MGDPLAVLAGPGTGKTRVIVERVAHLIGVRGLEPESILAVTFTVKAAGQLRDRLAGLIGPQSAAALRVHTFNGYGMRLLQRFGDLLGLPPDLSLIDAAQASRLIRALVREHSLFPESRAQGLPALAAQLSEAFETLANLGKLPDEAVRFAREKLASARVETETAAMALAQRFEHEALAYEAFAHERWRRGWLSYADQVLLPIRLLREYPTARAIVRHDLRAVIVDEFQDCNPAQIELLRLLAAPDPQLPTPDVCVVGDDDQAIYGFRGSDDRTFQRFDRFWPQNTVIRLEENYRSAPQILEVSNEVIRRAACRFAPEKVITPTKPAPGVVEAVHMADDTGFAPIIAAMIRRARASEPPLPWKAFAVIARTHGDLDRVADAFRLEGIPFDRSREKDPLDEDGVADVLAWARWIINPSASWEARRVLTRPPFGVPAERVLDDELTYAAQRSQAHAGAPGVSDPGPFAAWLAARHPNDPAIGRAVHLYDTLRAEVATLRGDAAVWRIITATDPAHADLLPGRERARRVSALVALLALARDKQPRIAAPGDLAALLDHFDELRALRGLTLTTPLGDVDDEPTQTEGIDEGHGRVQLLTAFRAKGLEFHTVFVPRVAPSNGYPKTREEDSWQPPAGLDERPGGRSTTEARLDEERRIFYVACTRAEHRLVLLAKKNKGSSKSMHFMEELLRTPSAPMPISELSADQLLAAGSVQQFSSLTSAAAGLPAREAALEAAGDLRRLARLAAAAALESAPAALPEARAALDLAAQRMAAIAQIERASDVSPWQRDPDPVVRELATKFAGASSARVLSAVDLLIRPMPAPLRLSYTAVNEWDACARCYYLRSRMGLPEETSTRRGVGQLAHTTLADFFSQWRAADAEGRPTPTADRLREMGRTAYLRGLGPDQQVIEDDLETLLCQLDIALGRLHSPRDHILEIEKSITVAYPLDGHTHTLEAKMDRLDLLPDGSYRIIDYKTSPRPRAAHLRPAADDLQLGIYALALAHYAGGPVKGVAEYWSLATGARGSIALDAIKEAKVRAKIDKAARGMLEGRFDANPNCSGPCRLLV